MESVFHKQGKCPQTFSQWSGHSSAAPGHHLELHRLGLQVAKESSGAQPALPWAQGELWGPCAGCDCAEERKGQGRGEGTAQNHGDIAPLGADEPQPWLILHSTASAPRCFPISQFGSIKHKSNVPILVGFISENVWYRKHSSEVRNSSPVRRIGRQNTTTVFFLLGGRQVNKLPSLNHFWQPDLKCLVLTCSLSPTLPKKNSGLQQLFLWVLFMAPQCQNCPPKTVSPTEECGVGQGKNAFGFLLWSLGMPEQLTTNWD